MSEAYERAYQALRKRCTDEEIERDLDELYRRGFIFLVARIRAIHEREKDAAS